MGHYDENIAKNGSGRLANIPAQTEEPQGRNNPEATAPIAAEDEDAFLPLSMTDEPEPAKQKTVKKASSGKKKKETKELLTDPHGGKRRQKPDDPPIDKKKFSIYLDAKLSASVRLVYAISGKKFSHLAEDALCDMLYNRYQCRNCTTTFSMSGTDTPPVYCPNCRQSDLAHLQIDSL